jgi:transmembrane sensor
MDVKNDILKELKAENPDLFNQLLEEREAAERYDAYGKVDSEAAWQHFRTSHFAKHRLYLRPGKQAGTSRRNAWRLSAAAAVACVLMAATALWFGKASTDAPRQIAEAQQSAARQSGKTVTSKTQSQNVTMQTPVATTILPSAPMPAEFFKGDAPVDILSTGSGDRKLTLSDGTTVWLNNGATLKYPSSFEADNRTVYLTGEAYFEVSHESGRPFYVRTDNGIVKEYGTSFNVNATAHSTTVTLVEGSISVIAAGGGEKAIAPGEQAVMRQGTTTVSYHDITNDIAWKTGIYRMDNKTVGELAELLAEWYDCQVQFRSRETRDVRFSGIVNRNKSLSTILTAISYATDVKVHLVDGCIIFE